MRFWIWWSVNGELGCRTGLTHRISSPRFGIALVAFFCGDVIMHAGPADSFMHITVRAKLFFNSRPDFVFVFSNVALFPS